MKWKKSVKLSLLLIPRLFVKVNKDCGNDPLHAMSDNNLQKCVDFSKQIQLLNLGVLQQ